ncbi:MAG: hypothetical protein Kow006_18670 [Gammaproteobacteria bacterium]
MTGKFSRVFGLPKPIEKQYETRDDPDAEKTGHNELGHQDGIESHREYFLLVSPPQA